MTAIESAIGDLKTSIEQNDIAGMKRRMEALNAAQHKAAETMYRAANAPGSAPGGEPAGEPGAVDRSVELRPSRGQLPEPEQGGRRQNRTHHGRAPFPGP